MADRGLSRRFPPTFNARDRLADRDGRTRACEVLRPEFHRELLVPFHLSSAPRRTLHAVGLHVTLSDRLGALNTELCIERLQTFLEPLGLIAIRSSLGMLVAQPDGSRPLASLQRGIVMGWLVAQPEVVTVALVRRAVTTDAEVAHG